MPSPPRVNARPADSGLRSLTRSSLLSRPVDVSRFGVIYGGAQKNIGPSGLVVVIVREDLLGRARSSSPTMLDYKVSADNGSMYNTPPTLAWSVTGTGTFTVRVEGPAADTSGTVPSTSASGPSTWR